MALTDTQIRKLKKFGLHCDGDGLYLQVAPSTDGKRLIKSWIFRFACTPQERAAGRGKERQMGLGAVEALGYARRAWLKSVANDHIQKNLKPPPALKLLGNVEALSLEEARDRAAQARELRRLGLDPIEQRNAERAALRSKATLAEFGAITFDQCAAQYIASREHKWQNAKHRSQWIATLRDYVSPHFGNLPVKDISRELVIKAIEPIWGSKPETASRVRGRIEAIVDWATARGYRKDEHGRDLQNPARWKGSLEHALAQRDGRNIKRHAALRFDEIGTFMSELRARDGIAARALEFIILTATRSGEALGARWQEIDLEAREWTVPAARMKLRKEHRVPLSNAACELLGAMARHDEHIFPNRRGGPLSNMGLHQLLERMGRRDITVHGFRSTFRDWAAELTSFPDYVAEKALAHAISDAVEKAYRRGDLFEKRRQLMEHWATYCDRRAAAIGEVIPIRHESAAAGGPNG
jgi:integrase